MGTSCSWQNSLLTNAIHIHCIQQRLTARCRKSRDNVLKLCLAHTQVTRLITVYRHCLVSVSCSAELFRLNCIGLGLDLSGPHVTTTHFIFCPVVTPFSFLYHVRTCKALIRSAVCCVHGRGISILQELHLEKPGVFNLLPRLPSSASRFHGILNISLLEKADCNSVNKVCVNTMTVIQEGKKEYL